MDLEHTHLREADEAFRSVEGQVLFDLPVLLVGHGNAADAGRKTHADVFLKEAGFADSFGTADDAERAVGDVRQHVIGDGKVVVGQHELGHPGFGVEDFVGMRDGEVGL